VGDLCSMSKAGLLLSVGINLKIDVRGDGVEEAHSNLWLQWVGTAVAAVTCTDPRAADMAAFGGGAGANFACNAKVRR